MSTASDRADKIRADKEKVLPLIDKGEVTRIACDLVDIPSPTGFEKACADYIIARYRAAGIKVLSQVFEDGRSNAIGIIKGKGGLTSMLNGHMDTSFVGNEEHLPEFAPGFKPKAVIDGEWIYGLGVYNMKASLAAFLHAAETIQRAGIQLEGDLVIACVAGEIEKSQVDKYQGPIYRGGGCGTWYAITHGAVADLLWSASRPHSRSGAQAAMCGRRSRCSAIRCIPPDGRRRKIPSDNMLRIRTNPAMGSEYQERRSVYGMKANVTLSAIEAVALSVPSRVPHLLGTPQGSTRGCCPAMNPLKCSARSKSC